MKYSFLAVALAVLTLAGCGKSSASANKPSPTVSSRASAASPVSSTPPADTTGTTGATGRYRDADAMAAKLEAGDVCVNGPAGPGGSAPKHKDMDVDSSTGTTTVDCYDFSQSGNGEEMNLAVYPNTAAAAQAKANQDAQGHLVFAQSYFSPEGWAIFCGTAPELAKLKTLLSR